MPNLNVKGESARPSSGGASGGGGGVSKVLLIVVIVIVVVGGLLFVLNTTGVVKLWGKKAAPVVVNIPVEPAEPVVTDTAQMTPAESPAEEQTDTNAALEENLTKLESHAPVTKAVVTGTGMYTIQLSSWPSEEKANAQASVFADAGFESFVSQRGGYYTVNVGRFETKKQAREKAESMAHMLESMYVIAKVGN